MTIPQQRNIVFIDFDPSLGKEIQKPRLAVVRYCDRRRRRFHLWPNFRSSNAFC